VNGQCNGDLIEFCIGDEVQAFDCNTEPFPFNQVGCAFIDAVARVDCAVDVGGPCDLGGNSSAFCAGSLPGCELTFGDGDQSRCATGVGTCTSSDVFTCDGSLFIEGCNDDGGGFDGQPRFRDCNELGASCESGLGCLFFPGDFCVPNQTFCGTDAFDAVTCPSNGICPSGPGQFTHNTGTGETFTNNTPPNTSSAQGAIDACNAHFNTTTCAVDGATCTSSGCPTVTLGGICECTATHVWHFGTSGCYGGTGAAGVVTTGDCIGTFIGNWN
jgi:hypothetical protein